MFDLHCTYSGIALIDVTQLVLLARIDDRWKPISSPLRGTYDRFGGLDEEDDISFHSFEKWASQEFGANGIEEALELMRDEEAHWSGKKIHYSLVEAGVYDALPRAFIDPDASLPKALQKSWKEAIARCKPIDVEDSEQYFSLDGEYGCRARIDAALSRFASNSNLTNAIEANAIAWKQAD